MYLSLSEERAKGLKLCNSKNLVFIHLPIYRRDWRNIIRITNAIIQQSISYGWVLFFIISDCIYHLGRSYFGLASTNHAWLYWSRFVISKKPCHDNRVKEKGKWVSRKIEVEVHRVSTQIAWVFTVIQL